MQTSLADRNIDMYKKRCSLIDEVKHLNENHTYSTAFNSFINSSETSRVHKLNVTFNYSLLKYVIVGMRFICKEMKRMSKTNNCLLLLQAFDEYLH